MSALLSDRTQQPGRGSSRRDGRPVLIEGGAANRRLARIPFLLVLIGIFGIGMAGLLALNTTLQGQAFEAKRLHERANQLTYQEEALTRRVDELRSVDNLAARASKLGMRPNPDPAFIQLPDGTVIGDPEPVTGSEIPSLVVKTPEQQAAEKEAKEAKKRAAEAERQADRAKREADRMTGRQNERNAQNEQSRQNQQSAGRAQQHTRGQPAAGGENRGNDAADQGEQSRQQGNTRPGDTEQSNTGRSNAERGDAGQGNAGQGNTEQGNTEQGNTEQGNTEQGNTDGGRAGERQAGQDDQRQSDQNGRG